MNIYYRARLIVEEQGLKIDFEEYVCIHDTKSYAYCVEQWWYECHLEVIFNKMNTSSIQKLRYAKDKNIKVYRVNKENSRKIFATKEAAYNQLKYLKQKQIRHLERTLDELKFFIKADCNFKNLENSNFIVPGSYDLLNKYYNFGW